MLSVKLYSSLKNFFSKNDNVYVTKPFLPPLIKLYPYLRRIWKTGIITNSGPIHEELESELCKYLKVENISLCSNGTLALLTAIKSLNLKGEVITTPFSFIATSNALIWNQLTPVFADVEPNSPNIDPLKVEKLINKNTSAILAVHCYGIPCDVKALSQIAKKHNLKLIYDAAHAFGVEINGESILNFGDLSILSFHATKVFNTFEGGAIISHKMKDKEYIDQLKNFGFVDQINIQTIGINAKMSELNSAVGLVQLKYIKKSIHKRKLISNLYYRKLEEIKSIKLPTLKSNINYNFAYFPIEIIPNKEASRDELYEFLKSKNIFARRYFYPLISETKAYENICSEEKKDLINSHKLANQILCLPIFPDLKLSKVMYICDLIKIKLS